MKYSEKEIEKEEEALSLLISDIKIKMGIIETYQGRENVKWYLFLS